MSIRAKLAATAASVGILAIGWQVGTAHGQTYATTTTGTNTLAVPSATTQPTSASSASTSAATAATTSSATATSAPASSAAGASGTYTGTTVTHRFGTVTVTVTLTNGTITQVTENVTARDGHSQQINSYAVPTLRSEVVAANSADIDTVSGATYTSEAYIQSLQSALDQAK